MENLMKKGDFIKVDENDIFKITNIEQSFYGMFILSLIDKDNQRYVTEAYSLEWNDIDLPKLMVFKKLFKNVKL